MCGITGYWAYAGVNLKRSEFCAFTGSLAHRGPDGSGVEFFVEDRLWLGHRQLLTIDLSDRSHQPISYADGRYWLTFNGEIYNFVELRQTLRQLGYQFRSDTGSEVILAAYSEWGSDCQFRFNGMWAFAIWDMQEKRLFLSRDRFGVKPLLYADVDGGFAFASEMKAFLRLRWCRGRFDGELLAETLWDPCAAESCPDTLLAGVNRLPAGHCMTVERDGRRSVARWWDTLAHLPAPPDDLRGQAAELREIFTDSCRLRLRSDVPITTALSGGLDSCAIACTIAEIAREGMLDRVPDDWPKAFVAWFEGTQPDERRNADQLAKYTGLRPLYAPIDATAAAGEIEKVVFDLEEIVPVPLVGQWAIYREMRRAGVRASVEGHGADALLGGHHMFVDQAIDDALRPPFSWHRYNDLRRVRERLVCGSQPSESGEPPGSAGVAGDLRRRLKQGLNRVGLLDVVRSVCGQDRAQILARRRSRRLGGNPSTGAPGMTGLQTLQNLWFHSGPLPALLRCIDRASMAHGIEVRMPFLDWRLVTFGFALPDQSKIGGGYTKRILRLAMEGRVPDHIRLRTNEFHISSPLGEWSRGALRPWLLDISASREFLEASAWNGRAAREHVERAVAGRAPINAVWPVLNAHLLQQRFRAESQAELVP